MVVNYCAGCHVLRVLVPVTGKCNRCHVHGVEWDACEACGTAAPLYCTGPNGDWYCGGPAAAGVEHCLFAQLCMRFTPPYRHPLEGRADASETLAARHLQFALSGADWVDFWIVPRCDHCLYHWARVALWRRFGVRVGLLPGFPDGAVPLDPHRHPPDLTAVRLHLLDLSNRGFFAADTAPVVLIGLVAVPGVPGLPAAAHARLVDFEDTLSRAGGLIADAEWDQIDQNPGAPALAAVPLIMRLAHLLFRVLPGVPGVSVRLPNAPGDDERCFRRSLHSSPAGRFQ